MYIDDEVSAYHPLVIYSYCSIPLPPSLLCLCLVHLLWIQRKYRYLLSSLEMAETERLYLLQWMSLVCDSDGHQLTNEFGCPFFSLSCMFVLPASKVCASLSFVHECRNTCVFTEDTVAVEVESKACSTRRVICHYDYCNRVLS